MVGRTLIPSYLETNYIDSLRFQLCEIIFDDYKGTTFFLDQMLNEKEKTLEKTKNFLITHPELFNEKDNSSYWYPYPNVDNSKGQFIYNQFYPNTEGEITYFCKKGEDSFDTQDYLVDPVKLIFLIMCRDIKKMDCESDTAKKILKINNELFQIVIEAVGDTIDYNNRSNLEQMSNFLKEKKEHLKETLSDPLFEDMKEKIEKEYNEFNVSIPLLEEMFIVANQYALSKAIAPKDEKVQKVKI